MKKKVVGSGKGGIHGYKASGSGKGWMRETGCRAQEEIFEIAEGIVFI